MSESTPVKLAQTLGQTVGEKRPQIVGFNSTNADLPIITQRAIVHGLRAPGFGERPNKPWEGADYFDSRNSDYNVDLCPMLGRFSQTPNSPAHWRRYPA